MNYNFSEDIKSIREILGFSQKELAEKLGVEQVTVSRNELGKTMILGKDFTQEKAMSKQYRLSRDFLILQYTI